MSYESAGGSLKLKGISDKKIKKKKSKSSLKDVGMVLNSIKADTKIDSEKAESMSETIGNKIVINKSLKTKAELAFERYNQKKIEEKVLGRAEKSHKEHVELYNKHLDSLTEYNDIPKVSWTK
jgi:protein FAM32A